MYIVFMVIYEQFTLILIYTIYVTRKERLTRIRFNSMS